jgi:hypothetical protein
MIYIDDHWHWWFENPLRPVGQTSHLCFYMLNRGYVIGHWKHFVPSRVNGLVKGHFWFNPSHFVIELKNA